MSFANALPPRRYALASALSQADGYAVMLDANELLTPARAPLRLPTEKLAQAIAAEWNAQNKSIDPATMPLTQLAMTAVDRVAPQRGTVETALLGFLDTELISHLGEEAALQAFQQQRWQAVRDWLRATYNTEIPTTTGLSPLAYDKSWAAPALVALDLWQLTALQQAASLTGSLALALALTLGALSPDAAIDAAEAEGDFQAQRWGIDPAAQHRRDALLQDARGLATFIELSKE